MSISTPVQGTPKSLNRVKNEVLIRGPTTELVNSLLYFGIVLADGGRFAAGIERGVAGISVGFDSCR